MGAAAVSFCPRPFPKSDYLKCPHALASITANLTLSMMECAVYSHPPTTHQTTDNQDIPAAAPAASIHADYLKCPHALAWTMANLALSMMEFRDAYISADQWDNSLALVKWGLDWLLKAHVKASDNPADNAFVGQVSARPDHWYFGRPEHATNPRLIYLADSTHPGADLAAEYAAAFAAGAVLFKGVGQTQYAEQLYKQAKQAYGFAKAYPLK